MADQVEEGELRKVESMIQSMTPEERARPQVIDRSRMSRIARGSGRRSSDVKGLLQRFEQMREIMGSLGSAGGLLGRVPGMGRLSGAGLPGGMDPAAFLAGGGRGGPGRREVARTRARQKDKRKQARKARKRNRRR
jgi:signal recognition particle subunit SRP54